MAEQKQQGVFNANCPPEKLTMANVLDQCRTISNSDATFTWVSEKFLRDEGVMAWSDMPLWLPEEDAPQLAGFMFVNCDHAFATGLRIRPLRDTISDTLEWAQTPSGPWHTIETNQPNQGKNSRQLPTANPVYV